MIENQRISLGKDVAPDFIGCWSMTNHDICRNLVNFFENNREKQKVGKLGQNKVDKSVKDSIDIKIEPKDLEQEGYEAFHAYFNELHDMFRDYCNQWGILKTFIEEIHIGNFNIQKYNTGGHFSGMHSERTSLRTLHRVLVWMTYLNDVEEGGETEFSYLKLKVKPITGKSLIWPAEWTHAHLGSPVITGPKYIITGWFHLMA